MPQCIYCRETKPMTGFAKAEHVLPQSFGKFELNMTLRGVVCDDCNAFFSKELELCLARDTPDGLNRFLRGMRPAKDYRSLGKRSEMTFRIDSGPLKGVFVLQRAVGDELLVQPLPQVGFENLETKTKKWFLRDALPSHQELRALFESGHVYVHFCEVVDHEAVLKELEALGLQHGGLTTTPALGRMDKERIEISARLEDRFGRALTKVLLNYLAYVFGAEVALRRCFDQARLYARYGTAPDSRIWLIDEGAIMPDAPASVLGHVLTVAWTPEERAVVGQVSFHNWARYRVRLSNADLDDDHFGISGHFFDLVTRRIVELERAP